jgi:hypothetical protein
LGISFHATFPQDRKILQRIFDRIDSKNDNKIDKEELEQTLIALGYEPVKVTSWFGYYGEGVLKT